MRTKRKSTGIIKYTTVKAYLKDKKGMRSRKAAVNTLISDFDVVLEVVIDEAKLLARQARRNTIMKRDVVIAIAKHLKKQDLSWDQTAKQVIRHKPTELGRISKEVRRWIREHEEKKKSKKRKR